MSTAAIPPARSRRETRHASPVPRGRRWLVRLPLALVLAAAGIGLFLVERTMRGIEVAISAHLLPLLFSSKSLPGVVGDSPVVLFDYHGSWMGLRMTAECSIAFYAGAILLFGAFLLLIQRFSASRVLLATGFAVTTMVLLNQLRLAALAWVFGQYGRDTFEWAHSIGGSFLMIGGLAVTLTLFFVMVVRGGRRQARKRARLDA